MKIVNIDLKNPDADVISEAAKVINSGGIVVHPTDTTYGLAANIFNKNAIQKIFEVKGRDFNKPLIAAVRDMNQAQELVKFNPLGEFLFATFFPGPLTIVLPKKPIVPDIVTGGKPLGIRIPNCAVTLALSKKTSSSYSTTSANPSGKPAPYSIDELTEQFPGPIIEQIDLILDAGPLPQIAPSTVVDLTSNEMKILRAGPITEEQIATALKRNNFNSSLSLS